MNENYPMIEKWRIYCQIGDGKGGNQGTEKASK